MINRLAHTAIIVEDLKKAVAFYKQAFGFELREQGEINQRESAFIYLPDFPEDEIELICDVEKQKEYAETGIVNHLAFYVDDIGEAIEKGKPFGFNYLAEAPRTGIDGSKAIFFRGPNKELLQFIEKK